jgi:hypothetical protein
LAAAIAERLRDLMKPAPAAADVYVTRRQATALGIEGRALRRLEKRGELQSFRPGKTTLYRRVDVLALVENSRVLPSPATAPENDVEPIDPFQRAVARARAERRQRG